jgi:hypothetical protein
MLTRPASRRRADDDVDVCVCTPIIEPKFTSCFGKTFRVVGPKMEVFCLAVMDLDEF